MISDAEVLHVAHLARLALAPDEVGTMAAELSSVLGHIEQISKLDLDGVQPTSHVAPIEGGLRADVPEESLPRELALDQAPKAGDSGFLVPSPGA